MSEGELIYYDLLLEDNFREGDDLIVKVIPFTYESDPDIFMSKVNQYPGSFLTAEWSCFQLGKDACTINQKWLEQGSHIYIGISCGTAICEFEMEIQMISEYLLNDGVEFQMEMSMYEDRIFRFVIPDDLPEDGHILIKAASLEG